MPAFLNAPIPALARGMIGLLVVALAWSADHARAQAPELHPSPVESGTSVLFQAISIVDSAAFLDRVDFMDHRRGWAYGDAGDR